MRVLFFDPTAKAPYTSKTLTAQAMGASEASLMRVARALAKEPGYETAVFQVVDQSRRELVIEGVRHLNLHSKWTPDVIVHQRTAKFVEDLGLEYPKARHIVWMHDLGDECWLKDEPLKGKEIVCVSDFHIRQLYGEIWKVGQAEALKMTSIYNPVELDGVSPAEKIPGRLGFFSSPQKGLDQVVEAFAQCKKERPELELVVANPGYLPDQKPEGVTFLGQLPHPIALRELSKCQCLFYPQTVFPETMGVVLAEANSLGVSVLAHDMGAAKEVLWGHNLGGNYIADMTVSENVSAGLKSLLSSPGIVSADPRFSLSTVVKEWKRLLEGA